MRKYIFLLSIFILLLIINTGCPGGEDQAGVWFKNESNQRVYLFCTSDSSNLLPDNKKYVEDYGIIYTKAEGKQYIRQIYNGYITYDSLYVSVLSVDTVSKYDWNLLKEKDMVLQRYHLCIDENFLKSINWEIIYK